MDSCRRKFPVVTDLIPQAKREMCLDLVAIGVLRFMYSGRRALPLFVLIEGTQRSEHKGTLPIHQPIAGLDTRGELECHTSTSRPLRLDIGIDLKCSVQQIPIFGVYIATTNGHLVAISREFELTDEVDYSALLDQKIDIRGISEGQHILLLCLEVDDWRDRPL